MEANELGARLRAARENRSISQEAAAQAIGAPRTAVTHIEAGRRSVSTVELAKLAVLYERPINFFFEDVAEADIGEDPLVALFRLAPGLEQDPTSRRELSDYMSLCAEGAELQRILDRSFRAGPPSYDLPVPRYVGEAVSQGTEIANEERRRLDLGVAPIADMAELISDQGIWASGVQMQDDVSGIFLRHPRVGMAVLVNFDHVRARKRFSYAHEYGHVLMDRVQPISVSSQSNAADFAEKRANAFAAALLMPEAGVRAFLDSIDKGQPARRDSLVFDVATEDSIDGQVRAAPGSQTITYRDVAHLAYHFRVSYHAAVYRLRSLNIVSQPACEELLNEYDVGREYLETLHLIQDIEGRDEDPEIRDRELRRQVMRLTIEAYRRNEISRGRVLDINKQLGMEPGKLLRFAEATRVGQESGA